MSGAERHLPPLERAPCGLLTDHYELSMLDAALTSGVAAHRSVFEVFTRRLPAGRRYGVLAGTGRLVETLADFRFGPAELEWLASAAVVSPPTLAWLAGYRFTGTIRGFREGEPFVAGTPVLTVDAPFGEALLLETLILSVLNHDSAVASAGARMVHAAAGRPLVEAGGRRTHEWAAPAAGRAAYLVGFASTTNLEAGRRYGVPTGGTTGHAFVLAHRDERSAFAAQAAVTGPGTTALVDTFDLAEGIANAVSVFGGSLGAIRIDSGDLVAAAYQARELLDSLGAAATRIVVSGDLDEYRIAELAGSPVDRMLVGTELVTGSGAPTAGFVYKLVAVADRPGEDAPLRPVAKRSPGKATRLGPRLVYRHCDRTGRADSDVLVRTDQPPPDGRPLYTTWVSGGEALSGLDDLTEARRYCQWAVEQLSDEALLLTDGAPALAVVDLG